MNFIVTGYDYTDDKALERRMNAREAHMAGIVAMKKKGEILSAAAMLNDKEDMCGSTIFLEMDSREDVDKYIENEPYIKSKVWEKVTVVACKIPPLFK